MLVLMGLLLLLAMPLLLLHCLCRCILEALICCTKN
jgi:hypothetical protein